MRPSTWPSRFAATIAWNRCWCRLLDIAADRADGREDATWALFELLRIKKAAGELDAAARILQRATELLPLERVVPLARDLAERAGRSGNRRLGAELLERLRATAPADESVWRPLLDHYVSLRDRDGLARLVAETLPLLPEVAQRNELRMALARLQLAEDAADGSAAAILQDVLLEDASARGGAGAAGRLLRAQRLRGRPRRPAGAGVRHGDRGRAIPRRSSPRRFAWAACWNARTPSARPRRTNAR